VNSKVNKSFLLLFFKKDASFLSYNLLISLIIFSLCGGLSECETVCNIE